MVNYLAYFDVCLNIFKSGDLAKDVSPLKFYEYLATGKPIVSTPQPEQVLEYSDVVYIASTPEEFVEKCAVAIKEKSNWHTSRRRELGKASSWDSVWMKCVKYSKGMMLFRSFSIVRSNRSVAKIALRTCQTCQSFLMLGLIG
jgi:hypothetical protein